MVSYSKGMTLKSKLYILLPVVISVLLIVVFSLISRDFKISGSTDTQDLSAPDIEFKLPNGRSSSLKSLRGTPVLINFWATWCEPCLEEMPSLRELERIYRNRGLHVLAINIEDVAEEDLRGRLEGLKLPENLIFQASKSQLAAYKLEGIPVSILLDKNGAVLKTFEGPRDWDSTEMIHQLEALLKE